LNAVSSKPHCGKKSAMIPLKGILNGLILSTALWAILLWALLT
jgi:hypothetical protein